MAVSMRSRTSSSRTRATCRCRYRPTGSSRIAEGRAMIRETARATTRTTARAARHSDQQLVALYLDMLAAERGAGKNTLAAYSRDLEDFSTFLKDSGRSIAKANTADLRGYLGELAERGLRVATVARRLSAMRQLYRFLYAEGQ